MQEGGGGQKEASLDAGAPGTGTPRIVEGSIVRPAGPTHRRVEGGRQLVPQQESGQESNWFAMPYEMLVGQIDHFVERARARHPQTATDPTNADDLISYQEPFNAAEWLALQLQRRSLHEGEYQRHYMDLLTAWVALAHSRYTSKQNGIPSKNLAREDLELYVEMTNKTTLTLSPEEVTVLDAMAEVVGLPHKRGEATIDLTPFAQPSGNNQSPTPEK